MYSRIPEFGQVEELLNERIKEMQCLVAISYLSQRQNIAIPEYLQECVNFLPPAWHYPHLTCAEINYQGESYVSKNFQVSSWFLSTNIITDNVTQGFIRVYVSQDIPFLKEEEVLINTIANFIAVFLEGKNRAEDLINNLNNYQTIFNSTHEAFFIHEIVTGKLIDVNDTMVQMYGYSSKEEVLKLNVADLGVNIPPFTEKEAKEELVKSLADESHLFEWLGKKATGETFWVEITLRLMTINNQECVLVVARDTTLRRQQEQKIRHLNRLYATLSQINQKIVQEKDRASLFNGMCHVAVKYGKFPLAWVGLINPDTHQIEVVASEGITTEYLHNIYITCLDEASGRGPTGIAAREARLFICEDIMNNPIMLPWRSQCLKYGYRSSAAVPFKIKGKVVGVFTLYAGEVGFFNPDEQELLQEIGDDISFALDSIQSAEEYKQLQKQLEDSEERLRLALIGANQGLYDLNIQTGEALVTREYALMLGYDPDNFQETNQKWIERLHPEDIGLVRQHYIDYVKGNIPEYRVEFRQKTASGEWKWILSVGKIMEWDEEGKPLRMLGTHTDIDHIKKAEAQIEQLAYYDPLTNLPNRRLLCDRIENYLSLAKRLGHYGALLFVDLDHFKTFNDARGHDYGDLLVQQVARCLSSSLRQADTVARLGGDEFIILLPELAYEYQEAVNLAVKIAEKIRIKLASCFTISDEEFSLSASIGVTIFPKNNETVKDLMKEADTAMYKAKSEGRNLVRLFEEKMQREVESRFVLEKEIRQAIENREFVTYIQKQVDSKGNIIGGEALIRWQHPVNGIIPPIKFIPLAEETGLIVPIGECILKDICFTLNALQQKNINLHFSVNVSPYQFRQPNFVDRVKSIVAMTQVDAHYLTLEVTEGLIIEDIEQTITTMTELQKLGIQFSLDDFGTGYSSLSYLKRLPISELKIDKSFVKDVVDDENDAGLVEAIISVAQHFQLKIIAEGVENNAQAEFLLNKGCGFFQGYLYGNPQPMGEFLELVGVGSGD